MDFIKYQSKPIYHGVVKSILTMVEFNKEEAVLMAQEKELLRTGKI